MSNDNWNDIILNVEREADDVIGFEGTYTTLNNETKDLKVNELGDGIDDDFHKLYEFMKERNQQKWNKATLKISKNGDFSIDFNWDDNLAL